MVWELFSNITNEEKNTAVENLFERSAPSKDFFLMVVLSVLMAALGLIADSPAVIVGSMLIAPMLYPILGISMGIIMSESELVKKSSLTSLKAVGLGIAIAALVSLFFGSGMEEYTSEILARGEASLLHFSIGAVAGLAAAFALVRTKLSETLPGVAISVALIPPLGVVGIALSRLDVTLFFDSLLLFLINVAGVVFTASIVFSMMNFYVKRHVAREVLREEEEKIEKAEEEAEIQKAQKTIEEKKTQGGFAGAGIVGLIALLMVLGGGAYVYVAKKEIGPNPNFMGCTSEAKVCPDGSSVGRTGPNCEFSECPSEKVWSESPAKEGSITIISPTENELVIFPVTVEGFVNNNDWMIFEGEAGTVRAYDSNDKPVSNVSILKLEEGWLEKSLSGQRVSFNTTVGDREMISHLKTDTGYLMFSSNGAKDDDVISKHKVLVRFQKSTAEEKYEKYMTHPGYTTLEYYEAWERNEKKECVGRSEPIENNPLIADAPEYAKCYGYLVDAKKETKAECITAGCSGQLCIDEDEYNKDPFATTCEYLEVYSCYKENSTCERQSDGECGWTQTNKLRMCIDQLPKDNREDCRQAGGKWIDVSNSAEAIGEEAYGCYLPAPDAGMVCTDSSECSGHCLVNGMIGDVIVGIKSTGLCSEYYDKYGRPALSCGQEVKGGVTQGAWCY